MSTMKTGRAVVFGYLCWAAISAMPAAGQVLRGRVVDAESDVGIAQATVQLWTLNGEVVASAVTDGNGRFVLNTEVPGRYAVHSRGLGYAPVRTQPFDLVGTDTLDVEVMMAARPLELEPLIVVSEREALVLDPRLERRGFYEREARYGRQGRGFYLSRSDIERVNAFRVSDLFRDMPRMRLVYSGGRRVEIVTSKGCTPTFYIDGIRYTLRRGETIDEVIHPASIAAVEVYPGNVQPGRFPGAITGSGFRTTMCGSVVIWIGVGSSGD